MEKNNPLAMTKDHTITRACEFWDMRENPKYGVKTKTEGGSG